MAERGNRKRVTGVVTSDAMDKTVVVRVETLIEHRMYKKYVRKAKKYKAHDEKNECNVGDRVMLQESRPMSKDKRWRVMKVIERAAG